MAVGVGSVTRVAWAVGLVAIYGSAQTDHSRAAESPGLAFSCHVQGGGYAIKDSDGRTLQNGDGAPFPPGPPTVIRITRDTRQVRVTGAPLPHPVTPERPSLVGLDPVRFRWGTAQFDLVAVEGGGRTLRGHSESVIDGGTYAGKTMEAFLVGSCTPVAP